MIAVEPDRFLLILKSVQTVLLLLMVFFLGYIASYLTNQQIIEYCFNYNFYEMENGMKKLFVDATGFDDFYIVENGMKELIVNAT